MDPEVGLAWVANGSGPTYGGYHAPFALDPGLEELADKSTEGTLTEAERSEYDAYVSAIDFLTVLQSKARALLAGAAGG